MEKDLRLRNTFDQVAELYDKARPNYPEELFDELINKTGIDKNSKLLEIAPGTGQATLPLAKRGYNITAVEIGRHLAEILRQKLSNYPNTRVITGAFEDVELPVEFFDLIYVARALHWIKPEVRFSKPHQLLKSGSHLAIINTHHISDEAGDYFYHATQPLYNKYWPSSSGAYYLKRLNEIKPDDLDSKLFELTYFKCLPYAVSYTTEEYCNLLSTESDKLALAVDKRTEFLEGIKRLINEKFNGGVERRYASSLTIAKKVLQV